MRYKLTKKEFIRNFPRNKMLQQVYVPDDVNVWLPAEIISVGTEEGVDVKVFNPHGSTKPIVKHMNCSNIDVFPIRSENYPSQGFEDMFSLNNIHEASILDNLQLRFQNRCPYTYAGDICIAVNPYKWLNLYTNEQKLVELDQ